MPGFMDELIEGFGNAVADIRERAVEEAWFGRIVTERGEWPEWPEAGDIGPKGLNGDIFGPEREATHTPDNAGLLEHGYVLNAEPMREESGWPQIESRFGGGGSYSDEAERDRDIDLDR